MAFNRDSEKAMRVHFAFNEGHGVEHDGTREFESLDKAKGEAMLALAQSLQEEARRSGEIVGSVAGLDEDGKPLFSITMTVSIT